MSDLDDRIRRQYPADHTPPLPGVAHPLVIEVAGVPHGRPRARSRAVFSKKAGKWVAMTYQPAKPRRGGGKDERAWAKANAWFSAVKTACAGKMPPEPWTGPVRLTIDAYFPRPKRMLARKYPREAIPHAAKPDRDNVDKAVMDALKDAGLFADDSQACDGPVRKWYAEKGCGPGVTIVAERIPCS